MANEDKTDVSENVEGKLPPISFAEFLESIPPNQVRDISKIATNAIPGSRYRYSLSRPEIQMHCTDVACNGVRFFHFADGGPPVIEDIDADLIETLHVGVVSKDLFENLHYLRYTCSNCRRTNKVFAILAVVSEKSRLDGLCFKIGELPTYGPPTSSRLISLIGPDRETFLKGRRCENQGLGIGAFAYYRRVVENQKDRILDEIIKVLRSLAHLIKFLQP
jgi:hypothetical protein